MTGRQIAILVLLAGLALSVLVAADYGLRAKTGWAGLKHKKKIEMRPFLADRLFPSRYEERYQAGQLEDKAEDADFAHQRAKFLLQAVEILKDKENRKERLRLLHRVIHECSESPLSAEALARLILEKTSLTPPRNPVNEVKQLIAAIETFGVGKNKIPPRFIQNAIKALKKSFPADAQALQNAFDKARSAKAGK